MIRGHRRLNVSRSQGESHFSPIDEAKEEGHLERGRRRDVSRRDGTISDAGKDKAEPSSLDQDFLKALSAG